MACMYSAYWLTCVERLGDECCMGPDWCADKHGLHTEIVDSHGSIDVYRRYRVLCKVVVIYYILVYYRG